MDLDQIKQRIDELEKRKWEQCGAYRVGSLVNVVRSDHAELIALARELAEELQEQEEDFRHAVLSFQSSLATAAPEMVDWLFRVKFEDWIDEDS